MTSQGPTLLGTDPLARAVPCDCTPRDRETRERQRRRLEDLASAGLAAASLAHEMNSALAVLAASVSFAEKRIGAVVGARAPGPAGEGAPGRSEACSVYVAEASVALREARSAVDHLREVALDARLLSRPGDEHSGPVDIHAVLDASVRAVKNAVVNRAALVVLRGNAPCVRANESRLAQVFMNLVLNAAQSIPEGRPAANEVRVSTGVDCEGWATVEVSDTGCGIAPRNMQRIFEPFFTTKTRQHGTGLGLSISARIVREVGGAIAVQSRFGKGTVFRVRLPPAQGFTRMK
jgi:signal transduction histidine kinase